MARPKRKLTLRVWLSEQERAQLRMLADAHEMTQSDFVRQFIRAEAAKLRGPQSADSSLAR